MFVESPSVAPPAASPEKKALRRRRHLAYRKFRDITGRNANLAEKLQISAAIHRGAEPYRSALATARKVSPSKLPSPLPQPVYATQDQIEILQRRVVELSNLVSDLMAEKEQSALFRPCRHTEQLQHPVAPLPSYPVVSVFVSNQCTPRFSHSSQTCLMACTVRGHGHSCPVSLDPRDLEMCCPSCSRNRANYLYQYDHELFIWLSKFSPSGHRLNRFWMSYLQVKFPCE